ncbi:UDP-N-acetylmuramoyl-tripeptide--D-alanyl-D-alanine ligase [candidate division KSB1 bacterium]|nr:UDP-N-acetylmuramoyl-tripeptide--D-alanyl-D-alanine ligase [candidate division KSB1 bacterium]
MNLLLKELINLPACPSFYKGEEHRLDQKIGQIAIDSRKVGRGDLFIAIRGERLDGHQFVPAAIQSKALAVVVEQEWYNRQGEKTLDGHYIVVPDTLLALQEFSKTYRRKFHIPVIGLTGSVGKTTTKEMMAAILSRKFNVHKNEGNLNNHFGVPLTLCQLTDKHEIAIIEMGANHFGEIARLAEIAEPTHAIITAIGRAHLEFFGSLEGVAQAKLELFDAIKNTGVAFVNADDPMIVGKMPPLKKAVSFGFENQADVHAEVIGTDEWGCVTFTLTGLKIRLRTPGMHQAKNALAAACVGLHFGIDAREIKTALESYAPFAKRMEILETKGIHILNDCYNSNPDSAGAALHVLNGMKIAVRKIAVLADMLELGDLGEEEHRKIGELIGQLKCDALFGFGPLTRFTVEAAKKALAEGANHFENKHKLIHQLKQYLSVGDAVLIKGSRGMAMEEVTDALLNWSSPNAA